MREMSIAVVSLIRLGLPAAPDSHPLSPPSACELTAILLLRGGTRYFPTGGFDAGGLASAPSGFRVFAACIPCMRPLHEAGTFTVGRVSVLTNRQMHVSEHFRVHVKPVNGWAVKLESHPPPGSRCLILVQGGG